MINRTPKDKPAGYEDDLSDYGPWFIDDHSKKTIGWGFRIVRHLGEERFDALRKYGSLECERGQYNDTTWYLIVDWLTAAEAIQEFGAIKRLVVGPHKGFRSVTYGEKTFTNQILDPRYTDVPIPHSALIVLPKGDQRLVVD